VLVRPFMAKVSFAKTLQGHKSRLVTNVTGLSAYYSFQTHSGFRRGTSILNLLSLHLLSLRPDGSQQSLTKFPTF
jgi:hypothetical protein